MKKLAIVLTLALVLAFAAPVFANPFSDVPADHWAYDAISKLAADGIISGNPDGTFTGNQTMTRYQMATIVAKAMANVEANGDKVTAEDKATIDKLAVEYSGELKALGVRMDALEKKVGNVKFTGDARVRYIHEKTQNNGDTYNNTTDMRVRLRADATINDKFTATALLTTKDAKLKDNGDATVKAERYYVTYTGKKATVIAGRHDAFLGKGTIIDDKITGVTMVAPVGKFNLAVLRGRLDLLDTVDTTNLTAVELNGIKIGKKASLGVDYGEAETKGVDDKGKIWGVNFDYALTNKIGVFGEYVKSNADDYNKSFYTGLNVKDIAPKTSLALSYAKLGANTIIAPGITTLCDQLNDSSLYANTDNVKIVRVKLNHALAANTNLYVDWSQAKNKIIGASDEIKYDRFGTGLEFTF